jgi:hypothetical protein
MSRSQILLNLKCNHKLQEHKVIQKMAQKNKSKKETVIPKIKIKKARKGKMTSQRYGMEVRKKTRKKRKEMSH